MADTPEKKDGLQTKESIVNNIDTQLTGLKSLIQMSLKGPEEMQLEQKYKEALYGILPLANEIKNPQDKQAFENIFEKIKSASAELTLNDLSEIKRILNSIENEEVLKASLLSLQEKLKTVNDTKGELAHLWDKLKNKLPTPLSKEAGELKTKFDGLKNEYIEQVKKHPFLGKIAIHLLPKELQAKLQQEIDKNDVQASGGGFMDRMFNAFSSVIANSLGKLFESPKTSGFMISIIGLFGGLDFKYIKNIADKMGEFWKSVPEHLKNTNWFGESFLTEISDAAKGIGIDTSKINEYLTSFRDSLKIKMKEFVIKKLQKKGVTEEKIDSAVDKYFAANENDLAPAAKKFAGAIGDNKEANYGLFEMFGDISSLIKFLGFLVEEGIISAKDIVWNYAMDGDDGFFDVGMVSLGIIKDETMVLMGKIPIEQLKEKFKNTKLGTGQRQILEILIYRKGGPFFHALSYFAQAAATIATLPAHIGQDFSKMKAYSSSLFQKYDKQIEIFKYFEDILGSEAKLSNSTQFLKLSNGYAEMREFMEFWSWFSKNEMELKASGKTLQEFIGLDKKIAGLAKKFVDPIDFSRVLGESDMVGFRGSLSKKIIGIGKDVARGTKELNVILGNTLKGALSESHILSSMAEELNTTARATSEIISNNAMFPRINRFFQKIEQARSFGRQVGNLDNYYIFKNVEDAQGLMKEAGAIAREFPEAARFLFQRGAVITVAGMSIMEGDNISDKAKNLATSMLNLVPFVGGTKLILDSGVGLHTDGNSINVEGNFGQFATGLVIDGLDTMFLVKSFVSGGGKGMLKFFASPFMDIGSLVLGAGRTGLTVGKFSMDVIKVAKNGEFGKAMEIAGEGIRGVGIKFSEGIINILKGLSKRPGVIAGMVAVVGLGALWAEEAGAFDDKTLKEIKEELAKGNIDENIAKFQKAWPEMPDDDKKQILDLIIRSRLSMIGISSEDIKTIITTPDKKLRMLFKKFVNVGKIDDFLEDLRQRLKKFGLTKGNSFEIDGISGGIDEWSFKSCLNDFVKFTLKKDISYLELSPAEKENIKNLLKANYGFDDDNIKEITREG